MGSEQPLCEDSVREVNQVQLKDENSSKRLRMYESWSTMVHCFGGLNGKILSAGQQQGVCSYRSVDRVIQA